MRLAVRPRSLRIALWLVVPAVLLFGAVTWAQRATEPVPDFTPQTPPADASAESTLAAETTEADTEHAAAGHEAEGHAEGEEHGEHGGMHSPLDSPLYSVIPFAVLLLGIAILPLIAPHWWESNRNKGLFAIPIGLLTLIFLFVGGVGETSAVSFKVVETMLEYVAFIALLGSLFVISGGILIKGEFEGTPLVNTTILGIGGVLASFIGTTGAAMLLIRPILRANHHREHITHVVVFFIFIVANTGGLLTPLGDPPLFLGFLKGVPFQWTLVNLIPEWAFVVGSLLVMFFIIDSVQFKRYGWKPGKLTVDRKAVAEDDLPGAEPFGIDGLINIPLLLLIPGIVLLAGIMTPIVAEQFGHHTYATEFLTKGGQSVLMLLVAGISLWLTPLSSHLRKRNQFSFHAINEVGLLFLGIFLAMIPALIYLNAHGGEILGSIREMAGLTNSDQAPWIPFWATGILSSFLDNAPTYLTFLATIQGAFGIESAHVLADGSAWVHTPVFLAALSCGAVFMGANSYIGNGPNFMVKSIAEEAKVKMPSFFGYMLWALIFLVPLWILVSVIFFPTFEASLPATLQ